MKRAGVVYRNCPKCGEQKMVRSGSNGLSGLRWKCVTGCGYKTTDPDAPYRGKGEPEKKVIYRQAVEKLERLVITWAQNATPANHGFLQSLLEYCKTNNAKLLVIPGRYKNPTSS